MKLYKAIGFFIVLLFGFSFGVKSALADPQTQTLGFCWSPPEQSSSVDHYVIYESVNDSDYIEAGTTPDTCSSIEGIPGYTYKVKVAAVNTMGIIGPPSEESPPYTVLRMDGVSLRDTSSNSEDFCNELTVGVDPAYVGSPTQVRLAQDSLFSINSTGWQDFATDGFYTLTPGDGWRRVYAQLRDFLGYTSQVVSGSILVDTVSPEARVSGLPDYTNDLTFQIPYTYSDPSPASGVAQVKLFYKKDDGDWHLCDSVFAGDNLVFDAVGDGLYLFEMIAEDSAGNWEERNFMAEDSVFVDSDIPLCFLSLFNQNSGIEPFTNSDTIVAVLSYAGSPDWVRLAEDSFFTINSTDWIPLEDSIRFVLSDFSGDGWRRVFAQVKDDAGNLSPVASDSIFLDRIKPTAWISEVPDSSNASFFEVHYEVRDSQPSSGIYRVELFYKIKGRDWTLYGEVEPESTFVFAADSGDGYYWFQTIAEDCAGNVEVLTDAAEGSTLVDTKAPQVSILSPSVGDSLSCGAPTQIVWSATDESNILTLHIFYKFGEETSWDSIAGVEGSDSSYLWTVPNVVSDSCRLKIIAYDFLGNRGERKTEGFFSLVDGTPPQVEVLMPNGGERWKVGEEDTIRFRAEDNIGVDSLDIFLSYDGGRSYQDTFYTTNDSLFVWQITDSLTSDSCKIRVVAYDGGGNVGMDESDSLFSILPPEGVENQGLAFGLPKEFSLSQNYPNPFNPSTTIRYAIPDRDREGRPHRATLRVYNILGELVRTLVDEERAPGNYYVSWDGRDNWGREVCSGVYFYRLEVMGDRLKVRKTRRMVVIR